MSDEYDLRAAAPSHVGGVDARFHLKFFTASGEEAHKFCV